MPLYKKESKLETRVQSCSHILFVRQEAPEFLLPKQGESLLCKSFLPANRVSIIQICIRKMSTKEISQLKQNTLLPPFLWACDGRSSGTSAARGKKSGFYEIALYFNFTAFTVKITHLWKLSRTTGLSEEKRRLLLYMEIVGTDYESVFI